jgi:hypothetical protein
MAATFTWAEANGAGETETTGRTEVNWKNIDDSTTAYTSAPITVGNNSYGKYQYGKFSGTWNQILDGVWNHTSGSLGANIYLSGSKSITADADKVTYVQPTTTKVTTNITDATAAGALNRVVYFSATGPDSGTATTSVSGGGTAYTTYIFTQLLTVAGAAAGDTATLTIGLRYNEN